MNRDTRHELWEMLRPLLQLFGPLVLLAVVLGINVYVNRDSYMPDELPPIHLAPTSTTTTESPIIYVASRRPERWATSSTNYCHHRSLTASGTRPRDGVVAVSMENFASLRGSTWRVLTGPLAGKVVTVEDKGPKAHFDIWVPSCTAAIQYGVRHITVERVR